MKIAINGAGVGGPTLAWWLRHFGHEPVLIERAPQLRAGGYIIDFWGLGYDIAEKMGLIGQIRDLGYQVRDVRFVGEDGKADGGFSADVMQRMTHDRLTSLRRSDLAAALYGAVENDVETIFGDSIAAIEEGDGGIHVSFEQAAPRDFDLVVGADGLHSRVRRLSFGPEPDFEHFLGYHVAAYEAAGYPRRDELVYLSHTEPGRQISRFSMRDDRTLFLFVFRDDAAGDIPIDETDPAAVVKAVFGDMGWEAPDILRAMDNADDIYFDRVSQIIMPDWSKGRVALLGDAAACVSLLAGEGTGLAMTEAYVLAGELHRAGGDHQKALARYQQFLMPFLQRKQQSAAKFASSFAPRTQLGVTMRNLATRAMHIPFVADWLIGADLRDDIDLPDYET